MKRKFSRSVKKYIRREKARISRKGFSKKEEAKQIEELYKRFIR